jgi:hypothetical protein
LLDAFCLLEFEEENSVIDTDVANLQISTYSWGIQARK